MTLAATRSANAAPRHFEDFKTYAHNELAQAGLITPGRCFNPACGCSFEPRRSWQNYCSVACERAGSSEFRRWGHRVAMPLLVQRLTKYAPGDGADGELCRAARRFITRAQTDWVNEREAARDGI